jgi:hypothetical protein
MWGRDLVARYSDVVEFVGLLSHDASLGDTNFLAHEVALGNDQHLIDDRHDQGIALLADRRRDIDLLIEPDALDVDLIGADLDLRHMRHGLDALLDDGAPLFDLADVGDGLLGDDRDGQRSASLDHVGIHAVRDCPGENNAIRRRGDRIDDLQRHADRLFLRLATHHEDDAISVVYLVDHTNVPAIAVDDQGSTYVLPIIHCLLLSA